MKDKKSKRRGEIRGVFVKFVDNFIVKPIFKLILLNYISF